MRIRVDAQDGRRSAARAPESPLQINRDVVNVTHYSFGKTWGEFEGAAFPTFLIDADELVADAWFEVDQRNLDELIEVLLARGVAGRS